MILIADGGALVPAARKPLIGVERVLAFLARVADLSDLVVTMAWLNGMPGARFTVAGDDTAVSLSIENDQNTPTYAIRNPNKLGRLEETAELRR